MVDIDIWAITMGLTLIFDHFVFQKMCLPAWGVEGTDSVGNQKEDKELEWKDNFKTK